MGHPVLFLTFENILRFSFFLGSLLGLWLEVAIAAMLRCGHDLLA
jgi:hypothetical protein